MLDYADLRFEEEIQRRGKQKKGEGNLLSCAGRLNISLVFRVLMRIVWSKLEKGGAGKATKLLQEQIIYIRYTCIVTVEAL